MLRSGIRHTASLLRGPSSELAIPVNSCLDAVDAASRVALNVVLPKADDEPAGVAQPPEVSDVTAAVVLYLLLPIRSEFLLPFRKAPAVPVVAVHKHDDSAAHEHEVRASRQPSAVLPEAQSTRVSQATDDQLRRGVRTADARHHVAALLGGQIVSHPPLGLPDPSVRWRLCERSRPPWSAGRGE